jgi:hypothetical protein
MKTNFLRVGGHIRKIVRENGIPFYAAIAAILCIQHNFKDSLNTDLAREIATTKCNRSVDAAILQKGAATHGNLKIKTPPCL